MCNLSNRASISALFLLLAVGCLPAQPAQAQPLTTAFTYQGELQTAGLPATGPHDLRFRLYDAAAGGAQVGAILCSDNVTLSEGRFTVSLDFGAAFTGQQRFLEIEARADAELDCTNPAGFVILGPRQPLTAAPNATFALTAASANTATTAISANMATSATTAATATNATQLNGQAATFYQNATNLSTGTLTDLRLSSNVALLNNAQTFTGAKTLSNAANLFTGTFTGPGAGLTGLNASNIASGTLTDLRLSSNVALLSTAQTFTGAKTFSTAPLFTAAGAPFSVTGTGVITNLNADLLDGLNSSAFLQSVPNPLTLSGSSVFFPIIGGTATGTTGIGVLGSATATIGVNYGVIGRSDSISGRGVFGNATANLGTAYGVYGRSDSTTGYGVYGLANAVTGINYGVYGISDSPSGYGVYGTSADNVGVFGVATATTGSNFGGRFESASTSGFGVRGNSNASSGITYGVYGQSVSTTGYGVFGFAPASAGINYGVYGRSNSPAGYGVYGTSADNAGVFGAATGTTGANYGGRFESSSTTGRGVFGDATAGTGTSYGAWGRSASTDGRGVYGLATAVTGSTYGVVGQSDSPSGRGVFGLANAGTGVFGWATAGAGSTRGVYGRSDSTTGEGVYGAATSGTGATYGGRFQSDSTNGRGVFGWATASAGFNYGVFGVSDSTNGIGIYGAVDNFTGANFGVLGESTAGNAAAYGVFARGRLGASGVKSFRIDHPSDPENKYLLHYSTEMPEPQNAYNGKATLDGAGEAVVQLPAYFASINKDPRYSLTAVGAPMPMLHIAEEISEDALKAGEQAKPGEVVPVCSFRIAGGIPGAKVSWRIEAVRNDLWVRTRGAPVEQDKEGLEKGTYQHPELYGQPKERGMNYSPERDSRAAADRPVSPK